MKFRFVGGLDCPDWILAEIAEFTKLDETNFCLLSQNIAERLRFKRLEWTQKDIETLQKENSQVDLRTLRGAVTALGFIIEKSARNKCNGEDLEKEMLQLGMAAEHAKQLRVVYDKCNEDLSKILRDTFLREPCLTLNGHQVQNMNGLCVHKLECQTSDGHSVNLALSEHKLKALQNELSHALDTLKPYCSRNE